MDTDTGNNLEASGRGSFYEYLSVMTEYFDIFFLTHTRPVNNLVTVDILSCVLSVSIYAYFVFLSVSISSL